MILIFNRVSRKEVRDYIKPFVFHKDSMKNFWKSIIFLSLGKALNMTSPFLLKWVVNTLSIGMNANYGVGPMALPMMTTTGVFTVTACISAIGLWGLTKIVSSVLLCWQMDNVTKVIQDTIKRVSTKSFKHLHELDLNYHRQSTKNTVFGINRAIRSIEGGLRFFLGFAAQMASEFLFLTGTIWLSCGPKYMLNMVMTCVVYGVFTNIISKSRIK